MGNSSSSSRSDKGRKCRSLPNSPDVRRQLPVPYTKPGVNGGTAIPLPATVMVTRRCPPDKVRPLPPTPNQQTGLHPGLQKHTLASGNGGVGGAQAGISAGSGSTPHDGNSCPGSPQHNGTAIITQIPKGGSSLRPPQTTCKIPASPYATQTIGTNHINNNNNSSNSNHNNNVTLIPNGNVTNIPNPTQKQSMLEKLKLFNSKEKQDKTSKSTISKRTSSSSGFSSARSERSDSSLSLNEGPPGKPAKECNVGKKSDTANSSAKVKSSKLISSKSSSKDASGAKTSAVGKLGGDKSKVGKDQPHDTHIPITAPKAHKIPTAAAMTTAANASGGQPKTESKLKPASVGGTGSKKLDAKSESKTSLLLHQQQLHQPQSQLQPPKTMAAPPSVNTGIPKPMAAVKGTSKPSQPQLVLQEHKSKDELSKLDRALAGFGSHQNGLISPQHLPNNISNNNSDRLNVVNTISVGGNNNIMGSPLKLPSQQQIPSCMSDSMHSNSTQGASIGQHSNSSESSSVVYRPSGSESGSELISNLSSPHKSSPSFLFNDVNLNNNNNNKFNTVPSKILNTAQHQNGTIYEQEEKQITVVPMRPLLRGYNSHVTLPTRGARGHHYISEYCEDLGGQGYCSDGDALRKIPARYSDSMENGYLSEGGGGGSSMMTRQQYISSLRNRTPLPTTIEERCRSSRGDNLDSIGASAAGVIMDAVNGKISRQQNGTAPGPGGREYWGRMPEPPTNGQAQSQPPSSNHSQQGSQPTSPTSSRKDRSSPGHSRKSSSSSKIASSRSKGVPQGFGYVKKTNGVVDQQGQSLLTGGRTAHVSAVPRSGKLKVSGGTQTTTADFQAKAQQHPQYRSFSLTGPGAAQLSQSVKERFGSGTHSLPKPGLDMHVFQHRMSTRGSTKLNDGSLSDTQTYAEVKPDYSSYAMWLRHSNTASSRLSEGESLESFSIGSGGGASSGGGGSSAGGGASGGSGIPGATRPSKLLHHARGETQPPMHHAATTHSPRLNRSNSIRSTKSEKMYPSMLSRGPDVEIEPYYCLPVGAVPGGANGMVPWSQPTSPTPPARGFGGLLSPTHPNATHRLTYPKKNDEVHGSQASLLSGGSSLYGSTEERQATEVRRLKRELIDARDQVMSLSSQLSTNAHVVAAFEQSLANMTQRLQSLTATTEKKDSEILDMRQTIELLRKQSIQAGLTTAHMQSMGVQVNGQVNGNGNADQTTATPLPSGAEIQRHHSSDSMCSLNSVSSGCSAQDKKKKKGWLRSSFTKAFSWTIRMISLKWTVVLCGLALIASGTAAERPLSSDVDPPLIAPAFEAEESEIVALQEVDEAYRLPKTSYPTHYDLKLTTAIHTGEREFSGSVEIHLTVVEATNTIVVHHRSLSIQSAQLAIVPSEGADPESLDDPTWTYASAVEQLTFTSATLLNTGNYILTVTFIGTLSNNQDGFYISSYVDQLGATKYLATTQFESTSARMAFPCYDEPGLKATFALQITHNTYYTANSNMPYTTSIDGDTRVSTFETTPKMSTYLLAFVVSDFASRGSETNRVFARINAIEEVDFAVEAGEKILAELDAHLGIGYFEHMPVMKQFAIPDFSAGAMENWGLVTYREQYLLFNPELSTYRTKTNIATVIAHEFAHQWFGNLVTPEWWEYLWLNEGFATLYEYYAAQLAYPEAEYWELFNPHVIQSALVPDGLETTRPMTWSADTPSSISRLFDRVAYPKSGSVLNMMRNVLGDENWAAGLNAYLTERQFDVATAEHLYAGLQSAVEGKNVLPDGVTVKDIMDTWTTEAGYPVLSVRRTYETGDVIISQERFISDRKVPNTNVWRIPYNYATQSSGNFNDLNSYSWLSTKAARINTAATADEWIVFNQQQVGFYRVNYDEKNWELITNALLSNHESIHRLNRAQIIDDAHWLARSGRLDLQVLMNLLPYLQDETEYAPWTAANTVLTYFHEKLRGTESYEDFKTLVNHLIRKLYATLDVDSVSETETLIHKYLKQLITGWACLIGNEDCLQRTKDALKVEVDEGVLVHPDIATVVYCYGLRTAEENVFQHLYQRIYPTQNWAFRSLVINALGCSENKEFLKAFLLTATAGNGAEINYKSSERTQVVQAVYSGGRTGVDALIEFLRDPDSLRDFVSRLSVTTLRSTLTAIASRTNNQEELDLLNELLEELIVSEYITANDAVSVRATAQANFDWQQSFEGLLTVGFVQDLVESIDQEPSTTTISTPSTTTTEPISTTLSVETSTVTEQSTTPEDDGAATIAVSITLLIGAIAVTLLH